MVDIYVENVECRTNLTLGGNLAELFSRTVVGSDIKPISSLTKDFEYLRVPGMNCVLRRKAQIQLKSAG